MLVFITCVKHPNDSFSYEKVWELLNNTLYSVCSQKDQDFRVIVVCDKQLPLFHHTEFISKYTEFVEVDFPSRGNDVIDNFNRLGNLSSDLKDRKWWEIKKESKPQENDPSSRKQSLSRVLMYEVLGQAKAEQIISRLREIKLKIRYWKKGKKKARPTNDYHHIANVVLNKSSKLLIGILTAKKFNPDYVMFFDADDYVGNDIAGYVNSHPGENGWIMAHGYKMIDNFVAPFYTKNSFCGTGNIFDYSLLLGYVPPEVSEKSTQNELFSYVDSEFFITLGRHVKTRSYFKEQNHPFLEYPFRSVVQLLGHNESSEFTRRAIRGEPTNLRFQQAQKFGKNAQISTTLISYFNILPKNSPKVFCIGFQKTGTTSVEWLLKDMGYQVAKHYKQEDIEFVDALKRGDYSEVKQVSELFDAFQDAPWYLFFKEFDEWYPNSKFILTIRDSRSWWASFLNYFRVQSLPSFKRVYGYDNPTGHEKAFIERFEKHNQEVVEYFKDRPEDLLVVDVSEEECLEKISAFLGKTSSYKKMPHKNAKLRTPQMNRKAFLKKRIAILKNIKIKSLLRATTFPAPPIIIGGCEKSGTEQLLSILSCHWHIHAITGDLKISKTKRHPLLPDRSVKSNTDDNRNVAPIDIRRLRSQLFTKPIPFSCKRWCGVSSLGVLAYEELLEYFGKKLRIVNMVRDGRDVVTENHNKIMARPAVTSEQWVYDIHAGMKFENHPQVLTIRYEDLTENYEATIKKISNFIGEKDIEPFLNYPKGATIIQDGLWVGKWQQPEYAGKVNHLLKINDSQNYLRHYGYLDKVD